VIGGAIAAIVMVACGDPYVHTNPYDPAVEVTVTVSGPDSLFSYTELAHYSATVVPAFPDSSVQFASSDTFAFRPSGYATYEAGPLTAPPIWPQTRTVVVSAGVGAVDTSGQGIGEFVTLWRHSGYKVVVLTQRIVSLAIRCPDTHACDPMPVGGSWSVWADARDALGHGITSLLNAASNPSSGTPIATYVVRDPTVASLTPLGVRVASVTALKTGSTWIVASRDSLRDSLQLIVH
jgi:hypothetical protein